MRTKVVLSWLMSIILLWKGSALGTQQSITPEPPLATPAPVTTPAEKNPSPSTQTSPPAPATDNPSNASAAAAPGADPNNPTTSPAVPDSPAPAADNPSNKPAAETPGITPPAPDSPASTTPAADQKETNTDKNSSPPPSPSTESSTEAKGSYDPNLSDLWNCKYNKNFSLDKCIEIQSFFCSRCSRLTCAILENRAICLDICDPRHPLMQPCVQAGKMNVRKLPALPPDPKLVQQMMMQQQQMMMGLGVAGMGAAAKGIGGMFKK